MFEQPKLSLLPSPSTHTQETLGPRNHSTLYALDLGTTKFCLATLYFPEKNAKPIIKKAVVPSGGMRKGMVCHMGEAQKALDNLLFLAEKKFAQDIKQVYLGVAGSHLRSRIGEATLDLGGDAITAEDQNILLEKCGLAEDSNYEVLHNLPLNYQVDSRELVDCATGFSGDFLRGTSFVIEANKNYLKDLIRLCNMCGLTVKKLYAEPYASASVVVPYEQKQQGVVVVDIGGGTTDGIAFKNGKPVQLFTVNIGGQIMTQDLATCLQINLDEAHRIKHHFGLSFLDPRPAETMTIPDRSGHTVAIEASHIYRVLACRISELYQLIHNEIKPYAEDFSSGMILTGGGSELASVTDFIAEDQSIYVTKNHPSLPKLTNDTANPDDRITAATPYATVAGLLYLAWLDEQKSTNITQKATMHVKSFFTWLKEIA